MSIAFDFPSFISFMKLPSDQVFTCVGKFAYEPIYQFKIDDITYDISTVDYYKEYSDIPADACIDADCGGERVFCVAYKITSSTGSSYELDYDIETKEFSKY